MKEKLGTIKYNGVDYPLAFTLNVMEEIQEEFGSVSAWQEALTSDEPSAKALKFGFCSMINEGIDIENEKISDNLPKFKTPLITLKQAGRMITAIGANNAAEEVFRTVADSVDTEDDGKNV